MRAVSWYKNKTLNFSSAERSETSREKIGDKDIEKRVLSRSSESGWIPRREGAELRPVRRGSQPNSRVLYLGGAGGLPVDYLTVDPWWDCGAHNPALHTLSLSLSLPPSFWKEVIDWDHWPPSLRQPRQLGFPSSRWPRARTGNPSNFHPPCPSLGFSWGSSHVVRQLGLFREPLRPPGRKSLNVPTVGVCSCLRLRRCVSDSPSAVPVLWSFV